VTILVLVLATSLLCLPGTDTMSYLTKDLSRSFSLQLCLVCISIVKCKDIESSFVRLLMNTYNPRSECIWKLY
jgi:hypothetical protein